MEKESRCPVYKKCGGCQLDVTYPQQLSYKMRTVIGLLGRFGHVEPIVGMDDPLRYRCKVSRAFGFAHGRIVSGVWQSSSDKLTSIDCCALEDEQATAIVATLCRLAEQYKVRTYDQRTGKGCLRFVTVRVGKQTGEILVALGVGREKCPPLKDLAAALVACHPSVKTVVASVSTDRRNLVLGETVTVLYGDGHITDRLCGLDFTVSAHSFFQVNPVQTENLYRAAVEMAELDGTQTVIDAYCGVGTIGLIASRCAKSVTAVELNGAAVKNAKENVRRNGAENVRVLKGDAGDFMQDLAAMGETVDVVFTDPPRAGCSREFLTALTAMKPRRVVYISCNPETQARDLRYLTGNGYRIDRIRPFDMFPFTKHIETICSLSRK